MTSHAMIFKLSWRAVRGSWELSQGQLEVSKWAKETSSKKDETTSLLISTGQLFFLLVCLIFPCPFWEAGKGLGGTDFIFTEKKSTREVAFQEIRVRES